MLKKLLKIARIILFKVRYPKAKLIIKPYASFYSQKGQDCLISSLLLRTTHFKSSKSNDHWALDIGCNHPIIFSNTYFLERFFEFNTIAVDPLGNHRSLWENERPKSYFFNCAAGAGNGHVYLHTPEGTDDMHSYTNACATDSSTIIETKQVKTSEIIKELNLNVIDYCSIDVEGNELQVLQGIDFKECHIKIFSIENNRPTRFGSQEIRAFMKKAGYELVARFEGLDDIYIHKSNLPDISR